MTAAPAEPAAGGADLERRLAAARAAPDDPDSWVELGKVQRRMDELDEAVSSFRRAADLRPGHRVALAYLVETARGVCDWDTAWSGALEAVGRSLVGAGRATPPALTPFTALTFPLGPAVHRELAERFVTHRCPAAAPRRAPDRVGERPRLRVGYLSGDFRNHPVGHLSHRLFEHHDRDRFEVYCYSTGPDDQSPYRRHVERTCERFVDLHGVADDDAASRLHADGLDVLIDMSGHTAFTRLGLLASRPAPVQAHFLGYPGTTGAAFVDWFLTDPVASPPGAAAHFSERLVRLPHSYQVNEPLFDLVPRNDDRRAHGLPAEGVVFCCFNAAYKIDARVFHAWLRIVQRVPGSVLWILRSNPDAERRLRSVAAAAGVDAGRLVFAPRVGRLEHLARHRLGDVALDTLDVSGHTTTSDAIRMGLPVVTRPGESFVSRVSASLLTTSGVAELVCDDLPSYEELAVALGRSPARRAALADRVRDGARQSPLFDTRRFARALEAAIETMWELHREGDLRSAIGITTQ